MRNLLIKIIYKLKQNFHFFKSKNENFNPKLTELPFMVLITSFNNEKYCIKNLESVFRQNYSNFEIIYVDDCSEDKTIELAQNFVKINNLKNITLIKNKIRKKKLANLFDIIHTIDDKKIILELDGDDYLAHENVLKMFNDKFQKGTWLVHSNYQNNPPEFAKNLEIFSQKTPNFVLRNKFFRSYPWIYSGIRAYYAALFKKIAKNDLLTKNPAYYYQFFPASHDMAMFYPMLEMAQERLEYISEPLLIRNIDSPINDFKVYDSELRKRLKQEICSSKKYERVERLF